MIKMLLAHLSNTLPISSSDDKSSEEDKAGRNDHDKKYSSGQNKKKWLWPTKTYFQI